MLASYTRALANGLWRVARSAGCSTGFRFGDVHVLIFYNINTVFVTVRKQVAQVMSELTLSTITIVCFLLASVLACLTQLDPIQLRAI